MVYRPEVDGLRAIAVLPVILFHAGWMPFQGGFIGVDVFFVISGYLITSIILNEQALEKFSIANFYARRAKRLLPALYLVLLVCLPFAWFYMDPFEFKEFGQSLVATVSFSSNIYFGLKSGYFDTANELKPLLHTWSLSFEEQYYLLFPFFLILARKINKKQLLTAMLLIAFGSLSLAQLQSAEVSASVFYSPFSRVWELMIGSVVALLLFMGVKVRFGEALSALGLTMILVAIVFLDASKPFPSVYALLPTLGAALIILGTYSSTGIVRNMLASPVVVAIGVLSYSAYLWHQPIFAFSRIYHLTDLSIWWDMGIIVLTFVLAYFTKKYVEDFFRYKLQTIQHKSVLMVAALCAGVFGVTGCAAHFFNGFPERNALSLQLAQNYGLSQACNGADLEEKTCRSSDQPKVLLWGDSYAMHLANALNIATKQSLLQATLSACPPIPGYLEASRKAQISCFDFNQQVMAALEQHQFSDVSTVVISSTFYPLVDEKWQRVFSNTLTKLKEKGYRVMLVSAAPSNGKILQCIKIAERNHRNYEECDFPVEDNLPEFKKIDEVVRMAAINQHVTYVDLKKSMCENGKCRVVLDGKLAYRDDVHLSNGSAKFFANEFSRYMNAP
jgi:peptidoglycan/LPS O-acetylase OafA/YrhL